MPTTCLKKWRARPQDLEAEHRLHLPEPELRVEVRFEALSEEREDEVRLAACFQRYAVLRRRTAVLRQWRENALSRDPRGLC